MPEPSGGVERRRPMSRRRLVVAGILTALGVGVAAYLAARSPIAIEPERLGCVPADHVSEAAPPVGVVDGVAAFEPPDQWADGVRLEGAPAAGLFNDVAATAERAVAVGRTDEAGGRWRPMFARTADGRSWHAVVLHAARFSNADVVDVAAGGPGWVAVGSVSVDDRGGSAGAVWWSPDGLRWQRDGLQPVAYIHQIAVGDDDMFALASEEDGTPLLGLSHDAVSWEWRPYEANGGWFASVARADGEWVAVGSIAVIGSDGVPAVWRSEDGDNWSCRLLSTQPDNPFGAALRVLPGATTTLVVGHVNRHCDDTASCAAENVAWVATAEGLWRSIGNNFAGLGYVAPTVAPDGTFYAVNAEGAWRSVDGIEWELVIGTAPDGVPNALALTREGLVAAGATYHNAGTQPWVGLLPVE